MLQHPLEVHHAKNTARLFHLCVTSSRLIIGESFSESALDALMAEPKYTVLLYPPSAFDGHASAAPLDTASLRDLQKLRLVVLDATWRKSRKMLHQSPALQRLPRLALNAVPVGRYAIRRAHAPGQLSTLEATCAALAQLEGDATRWQPLLAAFGAFVKRQQAWVPNQALALADTARAAPDSVAISAGFRPDA